MLAELNTDKHSPGREGSALVFWRDAHLLIALFIVLVIIYLLTFSGEFHSIDELAIYAGTESLAQIRRFVTPQLTFAPFHNPVGAFEPGQSLAALPLYMLAQQFMHVNNIHALSLLNVFVTALTGATVFVLLRRIRYSATVACMVALCYGLATTAWPYARYFLREPLTGLMCVIATLCLIVWRQSGRHWYLAGCFLALACGIIVKVSAAIVVPVFLIVVVLSVPSRRGRLWIMLGSAGLLTVGVGMYVWRFGGLPPIARYTTGYPWVDFVVRSYGQIFSPAKGLVFYSPVLLVGLPGWLELWRRQRAVVLLIIGVMLATLYVYGNNVVWYGGWTWGPRFVVPLLPLLVIPLAGVLSNRHRAVRILVHIGAAFSMLLQLAVATSVWEPAAEQINVALDPGVRWYDPRLWSHSPALFQVTHWHPEWLNLLWWHTMSDGSLTRDPFLAAALALLLIVALVALVWSLTTRRLCWRTFAILTAVGLALVVVGCGLLLGRGYYATRDYPGLTIAEAREIAALVSSPSNPPFTLVSVSNEFHIYYWLGLLKGHFVHYWYSPAAVEGFEPVLTSPLPSQHLWLVVDRVHLQPDHSGYDMEFWLNRHAYQMRGEWVGGFEVFQYLLPVGSLSTWPTSYTWTNGIALVSFGQQTDQVLVGEALRFEFEFQRVGPISENYSWFVHLVRADGHVILGRDGQPQFGGAPTALWSENERVLDRRALVIPPDASPGLYTIYAGFVSPTTGRVPVHSPDGGALIDHVELGTLEVLPVP